MKKNHLLRQCIACRMMKERASMLRIFRTENGFSIDREQNGNGRGAWVCKDPECIRRMLSGHALDRSFKCRLSDAAYEAVREALEAENEQETAREMPEAE